MNSKQLIVQNEPSYIKNYVARTVKIISKVSLVLFFASIILLGVTAYLVFSIKSTDNSVELLEKASLLPKRTKILMISASLIFIFSRLLARYKYLFTRLLFKIKINKLNFDYVSYVKSVQIMEDGLFYDDDYELCKIVKLLVAPSTELKNNIKKVLGIISTVVICIFLYLGLMANIEAYSVAIAFNSLRSFSFTFSRELIIACIVIAVSITFFDTDLLDDIENVASWVKEYQN